MSSYKIDDRVAIDIENQIAQVKLNRPEKHNALDMRMFIAINKAIKHVANNKTIRVVIVSGEGESFCSGLDVKSVLTNPKNGFKLLWKWLPGSPNLAQRVTVGWRKLKVPVIMALHGKCWGGGMQVALGGDFRIAAKDASLSIMETRWGLIPDMGGTLALRENMPLDRAMELAMTAETLSAKEAKESQLVTHVSEEPLADAYELAEKLKDRSPDTNHLIKKIYYQAWSKKQSRVLAAETFNQWRIILGKNQKVAVKRALGDSDAQYK